LFTGASNITWTKVLSQHRFLEDQTAPRQLIYRDYSGSITSHPHTTVVRTLPHLISAQCTSTPDWGPVSGCPHRYISLPVPHKINPLDTAITRDDIPDASFTPTSRDRFFYLSTDHSFILSFVDIDLTADKIILQPRGVDSGVDVRMGVCLPLGSRGKVEGHTAANSMQEMEDDCTGLVYFHDKTAGVLFVRFVGTYVRKTEEISPCGEDGSACFNGMRSKIILVTTSAVNATSPGNLKADCRSRDGVYPKYKVNLQTT